MAYGFELKSDNGKLAFSSENKALQFFGKYTAGQSTVNGRIVYSVTVSGLVPGATPVVFVGTGSDSYSCAVTSMVDLGGGTWLIHGGAADGTVPSGGLAYAPALTFYVFSIPKPRTPSAGEFGLMVYDGNGQPTLDLSLRLLKIAAYGIAPSVSNASSTLALPWSISGITAGSIPANWACSAHCVGNGADTFGYNPTTGLYSTLYYLNGVRRVNGSQFGFGPCRVRASQVAPGGQISAYNIFGSNYLMFIDASLYQ